MKNKTWFVTGASKGLGLTLVKKLLADGYQVAATSRDVKSLEDIIGSRNENFLPLQVVLTDETSLEKAIKETVEHFGTIDVAVNNAGYGLTGALEELTDAESRQNFDVNVFGSLNVIRKVLPVMRRQSSGHIFNISSIGGFTGAFPGFGIYCATKFAVQGFTESLAAEIKPFGIHATVVLPGYFRTNFLESSSLNVPARQMEEYKNVREVEELHQQSINGNQPGDPLKAAEVMINAALDAEPPVMLFLGADAYKLAEEKIKQVEKDLQKYRKLATDTAF
ncbi:SDR family oxidoreductase [Ferruginibacter sp. HRS2-29]|uniref:SDR family oxidoreductase n=2 Tax=Ferruginibacter sp. HRS2-29 TaxID=2487334 RepID=UPI0020CD8DE4|nr:SDR family oxidoreductase [Ferruginibacter sp. HRS2-29]MCP9751218.1 SDR family oxidoreductase [Ferruginibacter sp. HRS2-29]